MAAAPIPALFEPAGDAFAAAAATRGPWDPRMMHGGAPSALLAHAFEQLEPAGDFAVARLTIEFLGGVPLGEVSVQASLAKPGKRFQIVDATLHAGERLTCLARAVRLRRADVPEAAAAPAVAPLPPPGHGEPLPRFAGLEGELFHPDATEIRLVGGRIGSGHTLTWIRLRGQLLPGLAPSPLVRAVAAADFANGLSWILPFEEWLFVNTELTVHLHREPAGEWIGLDARTLTGAAGIGASTAVLHDPDGPFGVCAQSLFVERRQG
jgi:acyl-Coa thioesterase superfamily protein/acyl-CoA thioesterase superfamily protein